MEEICEISELHKYACAHCKALPRNRQTDPDLASFNAKFISGRPKTRIANFDSMCSACDEKIYEGEDIVPTSAGDWVHLYCA
jgi:formylmethanofuran dehydrogenase subunit E